MNPICKLPCYMNCSSNKKLQIPSKMKGSNSKMLQIQLKRQLPAPKCYKFHQNSANAMKNERFQLQNVAKTVEMAVSSPKMLQIARKTGRQIDPPTKKKPTRKKNKTISGPLFDPFGCLSGTWIFGLDWISTLGLGRQAFQHEV